MGGNGGQGAFDYNPQQSKPSSAGGNGGNGGSVTLLAGNGSVTSSGVITAGGNGGAANFGSQTIGSSQTNYGTGGNGGQGGAITITALTGGISAAGDVNSSGGGGGGTPAGFALCCNSAIFVSIGEGGGGGGGAGRINVTATDNIAIAGNVLAFGGGGGGGSVGTWESPIAGNKGGASSDGSANGGLGGGVFTASPGGGTFAAGGGGGGGGAGAPITINSTFGSVTIGGMINSSGGGGGGGGAGLFPAGGVGGFGGGGGDAGAVNISTQLGNVAISGPVLAAGGGGGLGGSTNPAGGGGGGSFGGGGGGGATSDLSIYLTFLSSGSAGGGGFAGGGQGGVISSNATNFGGSATTPRLFPVEVLGQGQTGSPDDGAGGVGGYFGQAGGNGSFYGSNASAGNAGQAANTVVYNVPNVGTIIIPGGNAGGGGNVSVVANNIEVAGTVGSLSGAAQSPFAANSIVASGNVSLQQWATAASQIYSSNGDFSGTTASVKAALNQGMSVPIGNPVTGLSGIAGTVSASTVLNQGANSLRIDDNNMALPVTDNQMVTPAQWVAVTQTGAGQQTLILDPGRAIGGSFAIGPNNLPSGGFTRLVVPQNVTVVVTAPQLTIAHQANVAGTLVFAQQYSPVGGLEPWLGVLNGNLSSGPLAVTGNLIGTANLTIALGSTFLGNSGLVQAANSLFVTSSTSLRVSGTGRFLLQAPVGNGRQTIEFTANGGNLQFGDGSSSLSVNAIGSTSEANPSVSMIAETQTTQSLV
jgi:hypothetical protein